MKTGRQVLIAAAALAVLGGAPGAAHAGTLDQEFAGPSNVILPAGGTLKLAQTLAAARSGPLDRIEVPLSRVGSPGPLTVQVREVLADGRPSSAILGTASVPASAVPPLAVTWVPVAISAPSVAGTRYAIVLSAPEGNRCSPTIAEELRACYLWSKQHAEDLYVRGDAFVTTTTGTFVLANNVGNPSGDFLFRTYVKQCPEIAPTGVVGGILHNVGGALGLSDVQQLSCSLPL